MKLTNKIMKKAVKAFKTDNKEIKFFVRDMFKNMGDVEGAYALTLIDQTLTGASNILSATMKKKFELKLFPFHTAETRAELAHLAQ